MPEENVAVAEPEVTSVPAPLPAETSAQPETDGTSETPAAPSWQTQPLPKDHWGVQKGFKTWGDADKGYRSSSEEARRAQAVNESYRQTVTQLIQQATAAKRAEQQVPAAPAGNGKGFFGYQSREAFELDYKNDPEHAMGKIVEHRLNPMLEERIKPIQAQLEERKEFEHLERLRGQAATLQAQMPEAKPGHPLHKATANWLEENPWAHSLLSMSGLPESINRPELLFRLATWPILKQQLAAQETAKNDVRAKAGTSRPGTGGKGQAKNATPEDNLRNLAASEGWTQDMLDQALELVKRPL